MTDTTILYDGTVLPTIEGVEYGPLLETHDDGTRIYRSGLIEESVYTRFGVTGHGTYGNEYNFNTGEWSNVAPISPRENELPQIGPIPIPQQMGPIELYVYKNLN